MSTTKRVGENAESKPLNLRLPHAVGDQLDALAASLPIVSRHRLAVEALRLGIAALMADPSILLRGAATPSTSAPATPGAPAPVRPVASPVVPVEASPATPGVEALAAEVARARALPAMLAAEDRAAPPVDPRQLPLLAPAAPTVVLHKSTSGLSIGSNVSNDNGVEPATPKPKRKMPSGVRDDGSVVDLDQLRARLESALAAKHSGRSIAKVADLNDSGVVQWRNGTKGLGASSAVKLDAALSKLGF